MRAFLLLLLCLTAMRPASAADHPRELSIAAASDLVFCLSELVAQFKAERPGVSVTVTTGASGTLTAQISRGAPFDVLMAADVEYPRQLIRTGHAKPEIVMYGTGRLVLWTMKPVVDVTRGLQVLREKRVARIAIANPDHAPYGRAAKAALVRAGLWRELESRIVLGENVGQTAQFIQNGHVDAGLVALSVICGADRKEPGAYYILPRSSYPPMEQGAVLTNQGAQNDDARGFLQYLQTAPARAIFKRYGFGTRL